MAKRLACRYYDDPAVWCSQCRAGRPHRCVDPRIFPDDYQPLLRPLTELTDPVAASTDPSREEWTALGLHTLGCVLLGAGLATLLEGAYTVGVVLVVMALALGLTITKLAPEEPK